MIMKYFLLRCSKKWSGLKYLTTCESAAVIQLFLHNECLTWWQHSISLWLSLCEGTLQEGNSTGISLHGYHDDIICLLHHECSSVFKVRFEFAKRRFHQLQLIRIKRLSRKLTRKNSVLNSSMMNKISKALKRIIPFCKPFHLGIYNTLLFAYVYGDMGDVNNVLLFHFTNEWASVLQACFLPLVNMLLKVEVKLVINLPKPLAISEFFKDLLNHHFQRFQVHCINLK